jgi:hypothetical protein
MFRLVYLALSMLRLLIHIFLVLQIMLIPITGISAVTSDGTDCCSPGYQQQAALDEYNGCVADNCDHQESSSHKDQPADDCMGFCHCCITAIPASIRSEFAPLFSRTLLHSDWTAPTAMLPSIPIDHPPC